MSALDPVELSYCYTPLKEARSFRILELFPGEDDEPLRSSLVEHHLDAAPEYTAISYCWGDPTRSSEIVIDGKVLSITRSLFAALTKLRSTQHQDRFWADAICIDQRNIPERNAQVRCMRDVYATASEVIVYLGEEAEESEKLPALFEKIILMYTNHYGNFMMSGDPDVPDWQRLARFTDTEVDLEKYDLPPYFSESWNKVLAFFTRPWFFRIWIIQEVAVAKNVSLICGHWSLPWDHFIMAMDGIDLARVASGVYMPTYERTVASWQGITHMGQLKRLKRANGDIKRDPPPPLAVLLPEFRGFKSTDARDKIYALLGMSKESFMPEVVAGLPVDYSETAEAVEAVFMKYAEYLLGAGELDLIMLSCMKEDDSHTLLPSWTPDWSHHTSRTKTGGSTLRRFTATNDTKPVIIVTTKVKPAVSQLGVRGILFDRITLVGSFPKNSARYYKFTRDRYIHQCCRELQEIQWFLAKGASTESPYDTDATGRHEIMWRTLCCDHDDLIEDRLAPNSLSTSCQAILQVSKLINVSGNNFRDCHALLCDRLAKLGVNWPMGCKNMEEGFDELLESNPGSLTVVRDLNLLATLLKLPELIKAADPFLNAVSHVQHNRRGLTGRGYVGNFPKSVRVGDALALMFGCRTPFLLRPSGTDEAGQILYRVVGWAYVHGVMFGEAMPKDGEDTNAMGCRVTEICLI